MKQLNPILSNDPNYYLRFTNKNPKVIKNYYAYKYIQKRRRFLKNMDKMLMLNNYHNTYYPELGIKTKLFTPFNLKSVPAYYYNLISVITEYFSCKAIWIKRFPKQTERCSTQSRGPFKRRSERRRKKKVQQPCFTTLLRT